ncbi:hypothetical protein [Aminiphilus circumscriptus]|uniref:hypothetical protein n=1 Tax=Aminiphilus circumscriptus TaxID=290732 RepID=UPI0012F90294|nr:hypothetical protein [Aminiphilus circumscriptus]
MSHRYAHRQMPQRTKSFAGVRLPFLIALALGVLFCLPSLPATAQVPAGSDGELLFAPLPPGWTENQPANESIHRYFLLSENDVVAAEMLFFLETLPEGMSLEDYATALQKNSLATFEGYTPVSIQNGNLQGTPVLIHDFLFSNQGKRLKARIFILSKNNMGHVLLFDGLEEQFPALAPKFDAFFFQTVSFKGAQQAQPIQPVTQQTQPVQPTPQVPGGAPLQSPADLAASPGTTSTTPGLVATPAPLPATGGTPPLPGTAETGTGGAPSQETLPTLDTEGIGELPPLSDLDEPGVFTAASGVFRIRLPEGAKEISRNPDSATYEGPDGSRLAVTVLESPEQIGPALDQASSGKRAHGTSTLSCAVSCTTRLYSFQDPESKGNKALLLATWQGGKAFVAIEVPADKYKDAGAWIRKFLCSAELK